MTIIHNNVDAPKRPKVIVVSNYPTENQITNWGYMGKPDITKSDVGMWRVKYKGHASAQVS